MVQGASRVALHWSPGAHVFACPGSSDIYRCTVSGAEHRWDIWVGAGSRTFEVRATDVSGSEVRSGAVSIELLEAPDCSQSASGTSNIWTCTADGNSRDRCVQGRREREVCARGCVSQPRGVNDFCAP
jgi:hypothetical protein